MEYREYLEELAASIERRLDDPNITVKITEVVKNNYKPLALNIVDETNILSPCFYPEESFKRFQNKEATIAGITEGFVQKYQELKESPKIEIENLNSYEGIKKNLRLMVVGRNGNESFLKEHVHKDVLDLSVVPYVKVEGREPEEFLSVTVRYGNAKAWGVSTEQLLEDGRTNMTSQKACISAMFDVLSELMLGEGEDISSTVMDELEKCPMMILTNKERMRGAYGILDKDTMKEIGDRFGDVAILPSSTHECIILPSNVCGPFDFQELKNMVKEVNATQVLPEEQLSDNVYFYQAKEHLLSMPLEGRSIDLNKLSFKTKDKAITR